MSAALCPAEREISQPPSIVSLVDLLRVRASVMGEKRVFSFLRGDGAIEASLTYRELHEARHGYRRRIAVVDLTRGSRVTAVFGWPGFHRGIFRLPLCGGRGRARRTSRPPSFDVVRGGDFRCVEAIVDFEHGRVPSTNRIVVYPSFTVAKAPLGCRRQGGFRAVNIRGAIHKSILPRSPFCNTHPVRPPRPKA